MRPLNQNFFKLRVTYPDELNLYHENLIRELSTHSYVKSLLVVKHEGSKTPHIHAILGVDMFKTPKAVGAWLRSPDRFDKGKGQAYLTCKAVTYSGDQPWSYLFHEETEGKVQDCVLLKTSDYTEEHLEHYRAQNQKIALEKASLQETGSKKDRGAFLVKNTVAILIDKYEKKHEDFEFNTIQALENHCHNLGKEIATTIYELCFKHSLNPSPGYIMQGYIKAVSMEYGKVHPKLQQYMIEGWVSKLLRE